jgi:hypothetical protein
MPPDPIASLHIFCAAFPGLSFARGSNLVPHIVGPVSARVNTVRKEVRNTVAIALPSRHELTLNSCSTARKATASTVQGVDGAAAQNPIRPDRHGPSPGQFGGGRLEESCCGAVLSTAAAPTPRSSGQFVPNLAHMNACLHRIAAGGTTGPVPALWRDSRQAYQLIRCRIIKQVSIVGRAIVAQNGTAIARTSQQLITQPPVSLARRPDGPQSHRAPQTSPAQLTR